MHYQESALAQHDCIWIDTIPLSVLRVGEDVNS